MPIYSYRCEQCGHQKDVLQKVSDPLLTTCPACHRESLRKQVTAAGFQLKGSGWYVTDFRDQKAKDGKKAADTDAPPAAASGESGAKSAAPAADGGDGKAASAPTPAPAPAPETKASPAPAPSTGST